MGGSDGDPALLPLTKYIVALDPEQEGKASPVTVLAEHLASRHNFGPPTRQSGAS